MWKGCLRNLFAACEKLGLLECRKESTVHRSRLRLRLIRRGKLEAVFLANGDDGFGGGCLAWRQAGGFFEAFFEAAWGDEDQVCGGGIFDVAVGVGDVAGQKGGGVAFEGQRLVTTLDFEAAVEDEKSFVFAGMDVKRDRGLGRCGNLDQGQGATGLVGGDQETVGGAEDVVDGAAGW